MAKRYYRSKGKYPKGVSSQPSSNDLRGTYDKRTAFRAGFAKGWRMAHKSEALKHYRRRRRSEGYT